MVTKEETIKAIKKSLRKANPKWSEEKVLSSAYAIFNSQQNKKTDKKEITHSTGEFIENKEEAGVFYSKGYAATTDFDRVGDILTYDCLIDAANQLNEVKHIDSDEVSWRHDRSDPKPMGIAEHNATVEEINDGSYGLLVTTKHTKTHDKYNDYVYEVQNGVVKGYSIEYFPTEVLDDTREFDSSGNYISGYRIINKMDLRGYGYASGRYIANPEARLIEYGYKEIMTKQVQQIKEEQIMAEEKIEVKQVPSISEEDLKILMEAKEAKKKAEFDAAVEVRLKELMKDEKLISELSKKEVEEKPLLVKEEIKMEAKEQPIEYKEFATALSSKEMSVEEKFRRAGVLAEKMGLVAYDGKDGLIYKQSTKKEGGMSFKQFGTNGTKLEFKGLGITSNQNTDTDYLLSGAELSDVFDPMIHDALNQSMVTYNLLRKDDFSNKGNNQVQFILETGANSTAGFYTGNSVATSYSTLLKMQTKFKKVQVGISVDGDMIAAARGGIIGDVFGTHVRLATKTLINTINKALFAEVGLETAAALIGFEYICDSAGNTTLYNLTRSSTNKLSPDSAADTYINGNSARISVDNLRKAIEQAVKEGADINNLVFITHPTQERLFKGIYDASQRLMPTSARFGFAGRPEFDAIPIFADKDCNTDDWYLVDLDSHRMAIWVPPTLEMLGKRSDSAEGFIKSYLCTYNTAPRRMVMIYGNATS